MKIKYSMVAALAVSFLAFSPSIYASDVIAKVNGKPVTRADLENLKKALPPQLLEKSTDKKKLDRDLLNQLVDLRVLTDAAAKSGAEKNKEVQEAIERAKEQVLVQAFVMEQLKSKLTEQAVENKYKELKDKFPKDKKETKARHILVKDEKTSQEALSRLKAGEDFQKVARELSDDEETAKDGGDLGYFMEGSFIPEFDKAVANLKPGEYTAEPIKTKFGYHIIKVEDRRAAKPPKFDDVKAQLAQVVQQEAMIDLVKKLRDKASVEILLADSTEKEKSEKK
jgi:peptidyl-prolyl cis-trans isomerase C